MSNHHGTLIRLAFLSILFILPGRAIAAETLIYDNSTNLASQHLPGPDNEVVDYGSSSGGYVVKFKIGYYTTLSDPGTIIIRFYSGVNGSTGPDFATPLRAFQLIGLPGAMPGYNRFYRNCVIPVDDQFPLPSGGFGYSYEVDNASTGPVLAGGGEGNEDAVWSYSSGWDLIDFAGDPNTSFYMKVYTDTPQGSDICEIHGFKFNDINEDGLRDANEPGLGGWEIYLDLDENGQHDPGEPNTITGTNPNGHYEFRGLNGGTYRIAEILRPGWVQTAPEGDGTHAVTLDSTSNPIEVNKNFGNIIDTSGPAYCDGTGEPNNPYQICTPQQMNNIGLNPDDWNKHFILMNNIDMGIYTGTQYNIIGNSTTRFTGVFDGNDHMITNLTIDTNGAGDDHVGLFGMIISYGEVRNLGIWNASITVGDESEYIGILCGRNDSGNIINCYTTGDVSAGDESYYIGGLCGDNGHGDDGSILNCHSDATVFTGNLSGYIGGLCGTNRGYINNCYATGDVTTGNNSGYLGGLCGVNIGIDTRSGGAITSCYATGSIIAGDHPMALGGLCGFNGVWDRLNGKIGDCYAVGNIEIGDDASYIGGFCGVNEYRIYDSYAIGNITTGNNTDEIGGFCGHSGFPYSGVWDNGITNCFWNTDTSDIIDGVGNGTDPDVIGESTANMQTAATYTDAGWDFSTPVWQMCGSGGYPQLAWEIIEYGGGGGTPENPYQIFTPQQMNNIGLNSDDWDKHFKLMADIDLIAYTGDSFNIIGTTSNPFLGVFDGDGHTIDNFTYESQDNGPVGIFGTVGQEEMFPLPGEDPPEDLHALIKNVGLISPTVSGNHGGSLIAYLERSSCLDCYAINVNVTCTSEAGGLIGSITNPDSVMNCFVSGNVSGGDYVGGFTGLLSGSIYTSSAVCNVVGNNHVGGFLGHSAGTGIYNCFSDSAVSGNEDVGGLTGSSGWGTIENCYSVGTVYGNSRTGGLSGDLYECDATKSYSACEITNTGGGLVGRRTDCSVSASFWDTDVSNKSSSAGGTGKTTTQMQTESTFTDAGWDFATPLWKICYGMNYPRLAWQVLPVGDFVCPDGVEENDLSVFVEQWLLSELSADIVPDGIIDYLDWGVFGKAWLSTADPPTPNWDPQCDIAPEGGDGAVDMNDMLAFAGQWLQESAYCADIAPAPDGDGRVDLLDFAVFAKNWLADI